MTPPRALRAALDFAVTELAKPHATAHRARNVVYGLIQHHDARRSFPTYRTAMTCCGIATSAASSCDLRTHELLLESWIEKATAALEGGKGPLL